MDILGKAILDYLNTDNESRIRYRIGTNDFERSARYYLRSKSNEFSQCENLVFDKCTGKTLDIACGTCSYHKLVKTDVTGMDKSKYMCEIAKTFRANFILEDIFENTLKEKFETIIMLGNSYGLGGDIKRTVLLTNIITNLLEDFGFIYLVQKEIDQYYEIIPINISYKSMRKKFYWVSFNSEYLAMLFKKFHCSAEVFWREKGSYVLKINKLSTKEHAIK